jgi:hypothetical protein
MTPSQKPEWIEIADADKTASIRGISKGLPVMALVAVAAIIGMGSIFAQTADQSPASAVETTAPTNQGVQASADVTSDPSPTTNAAATFVAIAAKNPAASKASISSPTLQNPSIGIMPTGGGDDDDEDEDEGDDDDDDEDEGDDDDEDEGDDD